MRLWRSATPALAAFLPARLAADVYERLPHGSGPEKLAALAATFLASVLWHGLQVGFLLAGIGVGELKEGLCS